MIKRWASKKNLSHGLTNSPVRSRNTRVTFVVIPGEAGISRSISLPRSAIWLGFFLALCLVGALAGISFEYANLRRIQSEYLSLKAEHESIRSEAVALYRQLQDVQSNLSQVDSFSNQVREATKLSEKEHPPSQVEKNKELDSNAEKKPIINSTSLLEKLAPPQDSLSKSLKVNNRLPEAIGPISEEDYLTFIDDGGFPPERYIAARVKNSSLEFGELFDELSTVQAHSSLQIDDLSRLLSEVNDYRIRLAKTPTIAPVDGRLTSHYGLRKSPMTGRKRMHRGLDIAAPLGSPIRAAAEGIVRKVSRAADYGLYVEISHGHDVVTLYAHAKKVLVKKGEQVTKGQKIALVGMTGRTTGPHLHYEVRVGDRRVNPYSYIASDD